MISTHKEIISFWLGDQSLQNAHSFYNLQAQQFFSEEEDPVEHLTLWKDTKTKNPRAIIMNTTIERLTAIRQINHKKLLKKMQKTQISMLDQYYFSVDMNPLQNKEPEVEEEGKWPEFENWVDNETNYHLIDLNFNWGKETQKYQSWKEYYSLQKQTLENKVRHQLEKCDYLRVFTFCSDDQVSAFTNSLIQYLRDECPKQQYLYMGMGSEFSLPTFVEAFPEVDLYLPFEAKPDFPYFHKSSLSSMMAPIFNCILTPFILKQTNPHHYLQNIVVANRKLFNTVYSLPLINGSLDLHPKTNIFQYPSIADAMMKGQAQEQENRVNFGTKSYLLPSKERKFISESYVLKGHFNDFEKHFAPKTQHLSVKYLPGILCAPTVPENIYDPFYKEEYGQTVEAYPFHLGMFSHQAFGDGLRKEESKLKKSKIFDENESEWHSKLLEIADSFGEQIVESD